MVLVDTTKSNLPKPGNEKVNVNDNNVKTNHIGGFQ